MPNSRSFIEVALGSPDLSICRVSVENYTADTVTVRYQGLPGNQPHTYQNFVAIWEATVIPWPVPPWRQVPVGHNGQNGTITINDLTITRSSYIIGYGVGKEIPTICTSARLDAGGLHAAPTSVQIGINHVGTHSVSVNYQALSGYLPRSYNNWIGLWKGYISPYNAPVPVGSVSISSDASEGNVGINDVVMGINTAYTLVYFVGRERTEAAAILTFVTDNVVSV